MTVVGVLPGVRTFHRATHPGPKLFVPRAQQFEPNQWILLRTIQSPARVAPTVTDEVRRLDPDLPPPIVVTVAQRRASVLTDDPFFAELTEALGILSVVSSAMGLFALLSLNVSWRMREMGFRMAWGTRESQVV